MKDADKIREFVYEHYIKPAKENGVSSVSIKAKDIHLDPLSGTPESAAGLTCRDGRGASPSSQVFLSIPGPIYGGAGQDLLLLKEQEDRALKETDIVGDARLLGSQAI